MEFALLIIGTFIIITSYSESKADNTILSKRSLAILSKTIIGWYILGATAIFTGLIFLCINYLGKI